VVKSGMRENGKKEDKDRESEREKEMEINLPFRWKKAIFREIWEGRRGEEGQR